jgi:hypothetical protein
MRWLALSPCCVTGMAWAGPPFQTDDPEPVPLHHYEINAVAQGTWTQSGRSGALPLTEITYGGAPDLQLHAAVPLAFNQAAGGTTQLGIGNAEFGAKYRFVDETDRLPMVATYPTYILPTGSVARGLGNGRAQLLLPVWLQKSWGPWTANGGVAYLINHAPGAESNWFVGALIQRQIGQQLRLGLEVFHRSRPSPDLPSSTGFNVGGTYDLDKHHHLLFSAGCGLLNRQQTNKASLYFAYQITG